MPVTTRKQQLASRLHLTKSLPSATLPVVNNINKKEIASLDQFKKNSSKISVETVVPIIEITGTMNNIDKSDYEDPFGADSFYESLLESSFKSNGQCGQTIDHFYTDKQRDQQLAYLEHNQQQIASTLFDKPSCLMSPPSSNYDPCSPAARSRSASATDMMVPSSPYENVSLPASPCENDAALDILDDILNATQTSQAIEYGHPVQSQDVLCAFDEMVCNTSQESIDFDLNDVLDFIRSQPDGPREMWTQEQTSLLASASTQESFSSQGFPSSCEAIENNVAAPFLVDEATIDEILSFDAQSACASPAQSVDSSYTTANSASPAHSEMTDEEYLPIAELKRKAGLGGNKRGRKRKLDGEFGQERKVDKKLKNAEAAARYRQKKKEEDAKASEALDVVMTERAKVQDEFNKLLKKRNLMLQLLFEANKKNPKVNVPSWVEPYLAKNEN